MNNNEIKLNNAIELLHKELYEIENSFEYKLGKKISKNKIIKFVYLIKKKFFSVKLPEKNDAQKDIIPRNNDYSHLENKKIAIYTCITGDYDNLIEPLYCNENIDYIIFTNNTNITSKEWKVKYLENEENLNNVLLNRYVKMHPHKLLKEYDYTIYVDGNIKIYSDLSSYINRIDKKIGLALSMHSTRNNLTDELEACKILKKGNIDKIDAKIKEYLEKGMPNEYGLLEAPVIVTDLHNQVAKKILNEWWDEFYLSDTYRDQIILPYILWKNDIPIKSIGKLSDNIWSEPKIEKIKHN